MNIFQIGLYNLNGLLVWTSAYCKVADNDNDYTREKSQIFFIDDHWNNYSPCFL